MFLMIRLVPSVAALVSRCDAAQGRGLPAADGAGEPFELGDAARVAVLVERGEPPASFEDVVGEVGLAQQLLGQVAVGHLAVGVADVEPREHPGEAGRVEVFISGEEPAADPTERVTLVAAMAQGGVLHPAANLVQRRVGQPDDVEAIDDQAASGSCAATAVA